MNRESHFILEKKIAEARIYHSKRLIAAISSFDGHSKSYLEIFCKGRGTIS